MATATDADHGTTTQPTSRPLLAALSAGAAIIHFGVIPAHAGDGWEQAAAFASFAWFQAIIAALLLLRATRPVLGAAAIGNAAIIGIWVWSRTSGIPIDAFDHVEPAALIDQTATGLQAALVLGATATLLRPAIAASTSERSPRLLALPAAAVLLFATAVLGSPSSSEHGHDDHGDEVVAAGGDGHDEGDDHAHDDDAAEAFLAAVDRCDADLNIAAYYEETAIAGVDTVTGTGGGHTDHGGHEPEEAPGAETASGDGDHEHDDDTEHDHDDAEAEEVDHSQHSDEEHEAWTDAEAENATIARLNELASAPGEGAAAALVVELASVSDEDYAAWLENLNPERRDGALDDNAGAGGHMGPQPWSAIDEASTCTELDEQVAAARDFALAHPTPADALADGYYEVTGYVPGIAAHYMKFAFVDGRFVVDEPEMLLYDGTTEDANVVGLSYYIIHDGDDEPADGFAGDNDHYHRHVGLCVRGAQVIGDTTSTKEECEAAGGRKQNGGAGWMSHAWVVPGCESPWGLFSAANPVLDRALGAASGEGEPCSGSGVRDRYDFTPGEGEQASAG